MSATLDRGTRYREPHRVNHDALPNARVYLTGRHGEQVSIVRAALREMSAHASTGPSWRLSVSSKLAEMRLLKDEWDGPESEAPSGATIDLANEVLELLALEALKPERVAAVAEGGISFYFFSETRELSDPNQPRYGAISVYNSDDVTRALSDRRTMQLDVRCVSSNAEDLRSAIRETRTFISV